MTKERRVVVAGWGQVTQPKETAAQIKDPLGLMIQASVSAAQITTSSRILKELDGIMVVRTISRHYTDPDKHNSGLSFALKKVHHGPATSCCGSAVNTGRAPAPTATMS